jgi:hypothetical protein
VAALLGGASATAFRLCNMSLDPTVPFFDGSIHSFPPGLLHSLLTPLPLFLGANRSYQT